MVDRLRDTSQSHERCSVVEIMGRAAGDLALQTGLAVGATAVIVPEIPWDIERDIIAKMRRTQLSGKKHFIIAVAEGVGKVEQLAKEIECRTGIESRATVLGHVQRGGSPSVRDRVTASQMGHRAVELLCDGIGCRVIAVQGSRIVDVDIFEALAQTREFDRALYDISNDISI
jgi:6-phosphofructokinase 1